MPTTNKTPGRTAAGFAWLFTETIGSKLIAMASQLLLAYLLFPYEFGLFAMTSTARAVADLVGSPGLRILLIQRHRQLEELSNPVFWLACCLGLLGGGIMFLFSLASYTSGLDGTLAIMLLIVAFTVPLNSLLIVPEAKLRAEMRFNGVALIGFCGAFTIGIGSVIFASCGLGAYSLVLPLPLAGIFKLFVAWKLAKPAVYRKLDSGAWKPLLRDSTTLFASRVLTVLSSNIDYFFLWLFSISTAVLGLYFLAFNLAAQTIKLFSDNLVHVLMPSLATLNSTSQQFDSALRATRLVSLIVIPLCFLQALVAVPVIHLLFKSSYYDMAPVFQILSVGMSFRCVGAVSNSLLNAQGRFREVLIYDFLTTLALCGAVAAAAYYGNSIWVAIAVCINIILRALIFQTVAFADSGISLRMQSASFLLPTAASTISWLASSAIAGNFAQHFSFNETVQIIVLLAFFATFFWVICMLTMKDNINDLAGIAVAQLSRLFPRSMPKKSAT